MRVVGSSRRPRLWLVGSRTSRQASGASYRNATVSSFALPDRSTSPVGPMVGLAQ